MLTERATGIYMYGSPIMYGYGIDLEKDVAFNILLIVMDKKTMEDLCSLNCIILIKIDV